MVEEVPLSEIDPTPAFSVRAKADDAAIERYREAYLALADMPPIKVFRFNKLALVGDGGHRITARRKAGFDSINADVTVCQSREEAERLAWACAFGANAEHGLPRSDADKRAAAATCLLRPENDGLTDGPLGAICKVCRHTVKSERLRLYAAGQLTGKAAEIAAGYMPGATTRGGSISDGKGGHVRKPAPPPTTRGPSIRAHETDEDEPQPPPTRNGKPKPIYDAKGRPVPSHLRDVFEARQWFKSHSKELARWLEVIRAQAGKPHAARTFLNDIEAREMDLLNAFKAGEPFVVCPTCGDLEPVRSCKCCQGSGWVNRGAFTGLTESQRKVVSEWEQSRAAGFPEFVPESEAA